ncbi:vitamin K epoxide reductase family protein [Streptomyces fildesensis]|uniref:Vitamin K epoxide reductase family protein n=1 Tax=Streptomyces fildesensis TaxID=375757 RepID=A0ABW8CC77_9ACTN
MTASPLDRSLSDGDRTTTAHTVGAGRRFGWLVVICGALGTLASSVTTLHAFTVLEDLGCGQNWVESCGTIIKSSQGSQAEEFGFPTSMIGMIAYPIVVCIGMSLLAGARYRSWFWLGAQAGTLFGAGFASWLLYQSFRSANSLCLWCCLTWAVTMTLFWCMSVHNIERAFIRVPARMRAAVLATGWFLRSDTASPPS